ncbi:MAG: penicillin-binding protein 1A [Desulfosalsimonadaceae bacterium]
MKKRSIAISAAFLTAAVLCGIALGAVFATVRDLPQIRSLEDFSPSAITRVYSADNTLLAELYKKERDPVPIAKIPKKLRRALIATEDRSFYEHNGVDLKGIARAIVHDIIAGEFVEGASTITQQLAKTLFLTPRKTLDRKLKEAFLAFQLERRYTKKEILELYLNQVYFGSGAYGVQAAAQKFFGKPVIELELSECALIAGLPKAPSVYSPLVNPDLAIERRNLVLRQMANVGVISRQELKEARSKPYEPPVKHGNSTRAPYFVDYVKKRLEEKIGADRLYTGGLTVETTLDWNLQQQAQKALKKGLEQLGRRMKKNGLTSPDPQGALIALDVQSGGILAMAGGRDYSKSPYNRATMAKRQAGSAFKPVVYARAIEEGFSQNSLLLDAPVAFQGKGPRVQWRPENFSHNYEGEITLRKALTHSKNIPAVRLIEKLGVNSVISFARSLGIDSRLSADLSLALGTPELTLEELTAAYAVFANSGKYIKPTAIRAVKDKHQRIIWQPKPQQRAVMSEAGAAIMVDMLEGVINEGTGKGARGIARPVGGKTGTTNKFKDALFVGFSPSIAAGAWTGCDDYSTLGPYETGARAALPIWRHFMKRAVKERPYRFFDVVEGLVKRKMNPSTGELAPEDCPAAVPALFRRDSIKSR